MNTTEKAENYEPWQADYDQKLAAATARGWEDNHTPDETAWYVGVKLKPHSQEQVIAFVDDLHHLPLSRELENLRAQLERLASYYEDWDDAAAVQLRAAAQAADRIS